MLLFDSGETARDPFRRPDTPDGPLPGADALLMPLHRLVEAVDRAAPRRLGVEIPSHQPPEALTPWLPRLDLVAVRFEGPADGRPFTAGRLLRRLGFAGQLRATGPFTVDQIGLLRRCGYDAFELAAHHDPDTAAAALRRFTVTDQTWAA